MKVVVTSYRDVFTYHYDLDTGEEYVELYGKRMTVPEFNRLQEEKDDGPSVVQAD